MNPSFQLSEKKRALLEMLLQEEGVGISLSKSISRRNENEPVPLSFAQQGLWFMEQLYPHNPFYNIQEVLTMRGTLNVTALEQSLNEIVSRHESLRTTFAAIDNQVVQVVGPPAFMRLPVEDLRNCPSAEKESEVQRLITESAQNPFDLANGPVIRFKLLWLDEGEYIFILTMHHIISDAWSLNIFFQELALLYEAYCTGQTVFLPALPIQYADFTLWQREHVQKSELNAQLAYWKQQFAGNRSVVELPADRPRPFMQTFRGAKLPLEIRTALLEDLKVLSRQEEATLFMTLLAAFNVLISLYTGQDDITIGTPIAGRDRAEIENLIGCFINTLVIRTKFSGSPTFRDLLRRVRQVCLEAYSHQSLPFEKLVQTLQPKRSLSHSPLFSMMFLLDKFQGENYELYGLNLWRMNSGLSSTSKFDLSIDLVEQKHAIVGAIEYSTDLFDLATIVRIEKHFQALLVNIVNNPDCSISQLSMLSEDERYQLLMAWNKTEKRFSEHLCIHQLVERQVEQTPEVVAVIYKDEYLTYRSLNNRANKFAHYLRRLGLQPEERVGICAVHSCELVVGLLGILKAGGAYLPLDADLPRDRLDFMLEDSQTTLLVTQHALFERPIQHHMRVIYLDSDWPTISLESQENVENLIGSENLAYIIYTSGSTGVPKGVMGTHRASINRFCWMWHTYPFSQREVCCHKTSLSFVDSIWEIFGPLLQGVRLMLIPSAIVKDPQQLVQTVAIYDVTRIVLVPSLLRALLDSEAELEKLLPRLKYWICSGEVFPQDLAKRFEERLPQSTLINLYGSSEVAADVTYYEIKSAAAFTSIPIGHPIDNIQIYLLDQHMRLVPIGVPGELLVGGKGLARGYFNRPDVTAERFIPNPFSTRPGALLYRTGDLARYRNDGAIEYLGRIDHQVKLRGYRIELGEIETVLRQFPHVKDAVVLALEDKQGMMQLTAYLVADVKSLAKSALRAHLKEKLPEYMLPSSFVVLDALPLSSSGKIDRRALPVPDGVRSRLDPSFEIPHDRVELQLAQIWERILNIHPIGVQDNFFELGGHSLLAVDMMTQIHKQFGQKLSISILFQKPTIEGLAALLREQSNSDLYTPLVAIQPYGKKQTLFFIHPGGGGVLCYYNLSKYLGTDQPFYGLEEGNILEAKGLSSVENLATNYINAIKTVQPEGPYLLGGWSFGGLVAFEMAQQLQRQNQEVHWLALLDTLPTHIASKLVTTDAATILARFAREEAQKKGKNVSLSIDALRDLVLEEQLKYTFEAMRQAELVLSEFESLWIRRFLLSTSKARAAAIENYRPQIYTGKITLFRAQEGNPEDLLYASEPLDLEYYQPSYGWNNLSSRPIDVYYVPGTHATMVYEPHVQTLAEQIKKSLLDVGKQRI